MKKRIITLITLPVLLLMTLMLSSCIFERDPFVFRLNEDKQSYTVSQRIEYKYRFRKPTEVVLPSEHNGLPVTAVSGMSDINITKVTIPDTVTTLKDGAFSSELKSVVIPPSVTTIENGAFGIAENSELNIYISDLAAWCEIDFDGEKSSHGTIVTSNPLKLGAKLYLNGELVTDIVIPSGVEKISSHAFISYSYANSVTIPESVKEIEEYAFYGTESLENVIFSDGLLKIGESAFENSGLKEIKLPNTLVTIENNAFYRTKSLENVIFSDGLVEIGESAFANSGLKEIRLPNTLVTIDNNAFGYTNASYVYLPKSVTNITGQPFNGFYSNYENQNKKLLYGGSLEEFNALGFMTYSKYEPIYLYAEIGEEPECSGNFWCYDEDGNEICREYTYFMDCLDFYFNNVTQTYSVRVKDAENLSGEIVISDTYNGFPVDAIRFDGTKIKKITLPNGVYGKFENCTELEEIVLLGGASLSVYGCDVLKRVSITDIDVLFEMRWEWLPENAELYINGEKTTELELVVPESVIYIQSNQFKNCDFIKSVTFPATLEAVGEYAFYGCENLTSVVFLKSEINQKTELSISGGAFKDTAIKTITLPERTYTIGQNCFPDNIEKIYYEGSIISKKSLLSSGGYDICCYGENDTWQGSRGEYWKYGENGEIITWEYDGPIHTPYAFFVFTLLDDGTYSVRGNGLSLSKLRTKEVIIPSTYNGAEVTKIEEGAFTLWSDEIERLTIPASISSFTTMFNMSGNTTLKYVIIEEGVEAIGEKAFYNCNSLVGIVIPYGLKEIGDRAFYQCNNLQNIDLPSSLESIGDETFAHCSKMLIKIIPPNLTHIGESAFYEAKIIRSYYGNGVYWGSNFKYLIGNSDSNARHEITVHENTCVISDGAFLNDEIISVTIPEKVLYIGERAFANCYYLKTVIFEGTQEQWGALVYVGDRWDYLAGSLTTGRTYSLVYKGDNQA